jgi:hypothetical protein
VAGHEGRRRHDPPPRQENEDIARVEGRLAPETRDQPTVERDRRHDPAEPTCSRHHIDREAGGAGRNRTRMEAVGPEDVERRLARDDPLQLPAVTALEGALERTKAGDPLRLRLGAIGALRVERERGAQTCLLPEGHLARLARACDGAEPPVRRRERDEREQHEVRDELEFEAAQLDPFELKRIPPPADSSLGKLSAGEGRNMSRKDQRGDAFRRRPPALRYSRRWGFQLEGLLRAGEQARRGFAERLLAGALLAVAVAGAVLIPRLLVAPTPGHELGVGAPTMTVPPVVLAPGLPGRKSKPQIAVRPRGAASDAGVVPSVRASVPAAQTQPVGGSGTGHSPRTRPHAQPQPPTEPATPPATQPTPEIHALAPTPLAPGTTTCSGTYTGTGKNVVVPGGATCVLTDGTVIAHDLTVAPGGTLIDPAVTVGHDLVAQSPAGISIHGDSVGHDLRIDGLTGASGVRNEICSTSVGHNLVVEGGLASAGSFDIGGACPDGGNRVGHDLVVVGNANSVAVAGNTVGHELQVQGVEQPKPKAPKPKAPKPETPERKPRHAPKPPEPPKRSTPEPPKPKPAKPPKSPKPSKPQDEPTPPNPAKPAKPVKPHHEPKPPKPPKAAKPPKPAKPAKPPKQSGPRK